MATRWRSMAGVVAAVSLIVMSGCSSSSKSTAAPSNSGSSSSGASGASNQSPLDANKAAVKGKKLVMGFSSAPTILDTVGVKTVQILKEEFGVDAQYKSLEAATMAAAVATGDVHVGEVSLSRLASMKLGGGTPMIFASNDLKNDYVVIAKNDIKSPAELKGKVWGNSSAAGLTVVIRNSYFAKAGLSYDKDVRSVLTGSSSATLQALPAGQIDAGLLHPDQAATLMEKNPGKFHVLYYTYEAVQLVNDVWFANKDWVDKNPEMAQAISLASIKAARWAYEDKAGFVKLSKQYVTQLSDQVITDSYDILADKVKLWDANGGLSMAECKAGIDISVQTGAVEKSVNCDELMTTKFQEKSLEILGKK